MFIISPRNRSFTMATIARYCRKTNYLSTLGFGIQITHKYINKSKKQQKVLPWKHLLPGIARKLFSSNPCRGMECKDPRKMLIHKGPRNKKMLPWQHLLPGIVNKLISSKKIFKPKKHEKILSSTHKITSPKTIQKECSHCQSCYQTLGNKHHHYSSSSLCKKIS